MAHLTALHYAMLDQPHVKLPYSVHAMIWLHKESGDHRIPLEM